jgi:hypothetical protein
MTFEDLVKIFKKDLMLFLSYNENEESFIVVKKINYKNKTLYADEYQFSFMKKKFILYIYHGLVSEKNWNDKKGYTYYKMKIVEDKNRKTILNKTFKIEKIDEENSDNL